MLEFERGPAIYPPAPHFTLTRSCRLRGTLLMPVTGVLRRRSPKSVSGTQRAQDTCAQAVDVIRRLRVYSSSNPVNGGCWSVGLTGPPSLGHSAHA